MTEIQMRGGSGLGRLGSQIRAPVLLAGVHSGGN